METTRRIVVTRDPERAQLWVDQLQHLGIPSLKLPLLSFASRKADPALAGQDFDWVLFTSPQGVRAFFSSGLALGSARVGTLGAGTAAALEETGATDNLGISAANGRELATAFISLAPEGSRVLLPGPLKRGPEVEEILTAAGFAVTAVALYETLPVAPEDLPDLPFAGGDVIFFCSPSSVRSFCQKWDARPEAVAIGETTAALARQEGFATAVADAPNLEAMLRAAGLDPTAKPHSRESQS